MQARRRFGSTPYTATEPLPRLHTTTTFHFCTAACLPAPNAWCRPTTTLLLASIARRAGAPRHHRHNPATALPLYTCRVAGHSDMVDNYLPLPHGCSCCGQLLPAGRRVFLTYPIIRWKDSAAYL